MQRFLSQGDTQKHLEQLKNDNEKMLVRLKEEKVTKGRILYFIIHNALIQTGIVEHDMVKGGGFQPTLVPNIIGYLVMYSSLPVTQLAAVFDNCDNSVILLLITYLTLC